MTDEMSRPSRPTKANDPTGDVPAPTLRALLRAVGDAEVLYLAFPRLQRALVVDPRPGPPDYPAVLVATLAFGAGGEAAIEQLRPGRRARARSRRRGAARRAPSRSRGCWRRSSTTCRTRRGRRRWPRSRSCGSSRARQRPPSRARTPFSETLDD